MDRTGKIALAVLIVIGILCSIHLGLALGAPKKAKPPKDRPYISSQEMVGDACNSDDAYGPCPARVMKIHNPLKRAVLVHFDCGPEIYTVTPVVIVGKSYVTYVLKTMDPGEWSRVFECRISSWKFATWPEARKR